MTLREILYEFFEPAEHDKYLSDLESQIKAWIEENVIGEDAKHDESCINWDESRFCDCGARIQNRLRQSQRQQLREEK